MVESRRKSFHAIGSIRPVSRVVSMENLQSELNTAADISLFVGPSCCSDAALRWLGNVTMYVPVLYLRQQTNTSTRVQTRTCCIHKLEFIMKDWRPSLNGWQIYPLTMRHWLNSNESSSYLTERNQSVMLARQVAGTRARTMKESWTGKTGWLCRRLVYWWLLNSSSDFLWLDLRIRYSLNSFQWTFFH